MSNSNKDLLPDDGDDLSPEDLANFSEFTCSRCGDKFQPIYEETGPMIRLTFPEHRNKQDWKQCEGSGKSVLATMDGPLDLLDDETWE